MAPPDTWPEPPGLQLVSLLSAEKETQASGSSNRWAKDTNYLLILMPLERPGKFSLVSEGVRQEFCSYVARTPYQIIR